MTTNAGNLSAIGFVPSETPPRDNFDPVPAGWYPVIITASEMRPTKAGDGEYLQLELTITDGEHGGRKVWDRLNLVNPNPTAVSIAQDTLSAICHAVGVMNPADSPQLHDLPMEAKISVRPAKGEYEAGNDVKGYRARGAAKPAAAPAAKAGGAPPWRK